MCGINVKEMSKDKKKKNATNTKCKRTYIIDNPYTP